MSLQKNTTVANVFISITPNYSKPFPLLQNTKITMNMKTLQKVPIELITIPDGQWLPEKAEMLFGIMYYVPHCHGASHLCLCGCGTEVYIPIKEGEWSISNENNKLTVKPSLAHRFECKSHYIITNGIANFV